MLSLEQPAWGARERYGVVWLAPAEPRAQDLAVPEATDPGVRASWLPPTRTSAPAGLLADAFLDPTHAHPGEVPAPDVRYEDGGFSSAHDVAGRGSPSGRRSSC